MSIQRWIDSPLSWAIAGFGIGLGLGVNTASVALLTVGLVAFVVDLWRRGPARDQTEGWLFASGGTFMIAWLAGFIVHSLAFA